MKLIIAGRRARLCTAALGSFVLAAAVAALPFSSAGAAPTGRQYVRAVALCKHAKAEHAQCFGMRLVRSSTRAAGARAAATAASYPTGPAGGFTPSDLATAYDVNPATSTAITVGIVDAYDDPNALSDLNTFDANYGLPAETSTSFTKVSQTGSSTALPTSDAGWAAEISLDLDAVRGLCHACKIVLVEATSNAFSNFAVAERRAVTLGATVVSNSWGGAEAGTILPSLKSAFTHAGIVFVASTADAGMYDWDAVNAGDEESAGPAVPSSLNTVVAVGGTSLYLNPDGTRSGETVWNENGIFDNAGGNLGESLGATGGGCSTQVNAQTFQRSVANYSQTGCGSRRLPADVSAVADPYTGYDVYDTYQSSGWQTFGGTSLAAPLIAAMWALAGGSGGVTYPAQSLYQHFAANAAASFNDITTGGNGFCGGGNPVQCNSYWGFSSEGESPNTVYGGTVDCAWKADSTVRSAGTRACDAATGYDGPSGLGTPNGLSAFEPVS